MKSIVRLSALAAGTAAVCGVGVPVARTATGIPFTRGDPVANGCAAGFEAIQVTDFPSGYRLPARIDDTANGGNGDGVVCAKPWTPQEQAARLPGEDAVIFNFVDNTLTPGH